VQTSEAGSVEDVVVLVVVVLVVVLGKGMLVLLVTVVHEGSFVRSSVWMHPPAPSHASSVQRSPSSVQAVPAGSKQVSADS